MSQIKLFDESVYEGQPPAPMKWDCTGWHSTDPIFKKLLHETEAKTVIEIGSWKGASAIHMAHQKEDARIICIDTWLGSWEHLLSNQPIDHIERLQGGSLLYWQFLYNVKRSGLTKRITPIQATSRAAAEVLRQLKVKAELCYVDGSHLYSECYADLCDYYPLTTKAVMGDDFSFDGVRRAVTQFAKENGLEVQTVAPENEFWVLRRKF